MKRIILGQTGLEISPLGMGTIQITRLEWKQSLTLVREVMDLGINWFDTARGYFDSELRLGEALKGVRDKAIIISKSGALEPEKLQIQIDESLERLQTDYLDIFLFHCAEAIENDHFSPSGELVKVAEDAQKAGKIRFLGFSAHTVDRAIKALDIDSLTVSMVPTNVISREYIDGNFLAKAKRKKKSIIGMKPFGGGRIASIKVCLKFLKKYPDIIPCIGIEKTVEMIENIKIWEDEEPWTESDSDEMVRIRELLGDRFCRGCGYCLPCPEGISIPMVTFFNVSARQMPKKNLVSYSYREAMKKATRCIECRKCEETCPYNLDIPEMLKENITLYEKLHLG